MRTLRWLLNCNVHVNARDLRGQTPLHYAMVGEEPAIAKLLIEHGAWRNARDKLGQTPAEAPNEFAEGDARVKRMMEERRLSGKLYFVM